MARDDAVMDEIAGEDAEKLLLRAHEDGGDATAEALAECVGGDPHYARELVEQLNRLGLAHPSTYDGELSLTGRGKKIAATINESITNGWRRDDATRRLVLESARAGGSNTTDDLMGLWGVREGRTVEEIRRAVWVLEEEGMIVAYSGQGKDLVDGIRQKGLDALGDTFILRPKRRLYAMTINNNDNSNHSRNVAVNGGTGVNVQLGDYSTQHNAVTIGSDLAEVRAAFEEALGLSADLPDQIAEAVRDALSQAIAETNKPEPDRGFIRELATNSVMSLSAAISSAAGQGIYHLISPFMGMQ